MNIRSITSFDFSGGLHELLAYAVRVQSIGDFVFFRTILDYLRKRIDDFGIQLLGHMMAWVGGIALTLMTLWVLIQGFRIVTGRSRDSMMVLVTNMARAALIVSVATSMAMFGGTLKDFLTKDLKNEIAHVVTGKNDSPEDQIDKSLAWMQVGLSSIDAIKVLDDGNLRDDKNRALWAVGLGTGGPAVTAGSMLLLYEVALALFIGLGPLFILCLLFDQTKQLFQKWLFYGIGTMFSMAVLAAMISIALDMVIRVSAAFWTSALVDKYLLNPDGSVDFTSQALQQGGMGLILTTLILTAPPMAAMFFQGTLGGFVAYSQIGGSPAAAPGPNGQPPGSYYTPATPEKNSGTHGGGTTSVGANVTVSGGSAPVGQNTSDTGRKGLASH
ncbi:type IV secretion system protein [Stenotrophomonas sp. TD3]|uniref:type IV secretion system protein n=2 Tax=Lysobacteraceae TaxID=32033 RepID=UPI0009532ED5|nr:type IV secretion system protein [Stenotrophomonas sp. TD3]